MAKAECCGHDHEKERWPLCSCPVCRAIEEERAQMQVVKFTDYEEKDDEFSW